MKKSYKFLACWVSVLVLFFSMNNIIFAEEKIDENLEEKVSSVTTTVNQYIDIYPSNNGCSTSALLKLNGSYDTSYNGINKIYTNVRLNAHVAFNVPDWYIEVTKVSHSVVSNKLVVTIRYKFLNTYYDCPIVGGWVYRTVTVTL